MELASSSVRTPPQTLSEGVPCIRVVDSGATHGVVASSSYGVYLGGRTFGDGMASVAGPLGRDQSLGGVTSSLYRSAEHESFKARRAGCRSYRGIKLGQHLVPGRWSQLGDFAGPSGRTVRTDCSSAYVDFSMSAQFGALKGLACGHKSLRFAPESFRGRDRLPLGSPQLGCCAAFAGRTENIYLCHLHSGKGEVSTVNRGSQFKGYSSRSGWILKRAVGFSVLPRLQNRVAARPQARSYFVKARRDMRAAATPADLRMSYPDVSSDVDTSSFYLIQYGDTLTSIAKKFQTSVSLLAQANSIEDVDRLFVGQPLLIPRAYERVPGPGVDIDEFPVPTGFELRASSRRIIQKPVGSVKSSQNKVSITKASTAKASSQDLAASVAPPAVVGSNFAKFAVPVLLIAPLLGFCIRCIVDALYIHMDREEARRQAEREAYVEAHRPKAKRWQKILEEDRDSDDSEGPNLMNDWPKDNVWSSEVTGPTENIWSTEATDVMDVDAREKTREILSLDQDGEEVVLSDDKDDYEDIRKSYAELESSYMKFLVDSGLSKSGYFRGGVPTTAAHNGEPQ